MNEQIVHSISSYIKHGNNVLVIKLNLVQFTKPNSDNRNQSGWHFIS